MLDHLPEPGQQLLRYWGWYSNAARGRRLTWAQLIRKVYEIDPLLCPYCGAAMRIVAFLVDFASLPPSDSDPTRKLNPPTRPLEPSSVSGPSCLSTLAQSITWPRCTLPTKSNFLHGNYAVRCER